jgi:hypothetical protein
VFEGRRRQESTCQLLPKLPTDVEKKNMVAHRRNWVEVEVRGLEELSIEIRWSRSRGRRDG